MASNGRQRAARGSTNVYDGSGSDPYPLKAHHIAPLPPPGSARGAVPPVSAARRCLKDPQSTEFIRPTPRAGEDGDRGMGLDSRIRDTRDKTPASRKRMSTPRLTPRSQADIVQFTSAIFFAGEGEAEAHIDIMRIGRASDRCSVEVYTTEGSAKANKFSPLVNEVVVFERGEVLKTVVVTICDDSSFDTTLEFKCHIQAPENCVLGRYLGTARVMILDDDIFPSNKFQKVCKGLATDVDAAEESLSKITGALLIDFMRFCFLRVPTLWWKTVLYCLLDQLHNAYYLLQIYIKMYLVDVALRLDDPSTLDELLVPGNRYLTAIALAVIWIVPNIILLFADRLKAGPLDCNRPLRVYLQASLFRKYLNYDSESHEKVPMQDLTVTMNSDVPGLVENGYEFGFALMRGGGKILIVGMFMLTHDWRTVVPFLIYPSLMFVFIKARQAENVELDAQLISAEAASEGCVMSASESFLLIRDYRMRNALTAKFEARLADSFVANNAVRVFNFWNQQLVPWITLACLCSYLALGAQLVIVGVQSLGSFLAMLEIYKECGDRFQGMFDDLQRGVLAGSPLVQLVKMLNLPTDLKGRMKNNRMKRQYVKEAVDIDRGNRGKASPEDEKSIFDRIPLEVRDLKVPYVKAISALKLKVPPEQVVFVTGCRESGKSTLLHALSGIVRPSRGEVIFGSHCRMLNVSSLSQVIPECDLYGNLTFGTHHPDPDRVRRVFKRLQLDRGKKLRHLLEAQIESAHQERVREAAAVERRKVKLEKMKTMEGEIAGEYERMQSLLGGHSASDDEVIPTMASGVMPEADPTAGSQHWYGELSFSELQRIHLARALIFNPEILVIHRPIDDIGSEDCAETLSLIREFVDQRGVELDSVGRHTRRPRTVFFSGGENSNMHGSSSIADIIWQLDSDKLTVSPGGHAPGNSFIMPVVGPPARELTATDEGRPHLTRTLSSMSGQDSKRPTSEPPGRVSDSFDYNPEKVQSPVRDVGRESKFRETPMTCWSRKSCVPIPT